ncbi:MAG: LysM peptidoglycan-binding domain-containing protein [Bacteroidetes bacterium]|nr:LysM peptidoglycan-binding domain-containing protein [Bacteroidota bacterium]
MKAYYFVVWLILLLVIPFRANAQSAESYTVKPGDTLFSISRAYNISVNDLKRLNALENGNIRSGMKLIVSKEAKEIEAEAESAELKSAVVAPILPSTALSVDPTEPPLESDPTYSLLSVADQLEIDVDELKQLNEDIEVDITRLNQIGPAVDSSGKTYVVKPGDTLFKIAQSHDMTVRQLSDFNSMSRSTVQSGQKIKVPGAQQAGSAVWKSLGEIDAVMYPSTYVGRTMASGLVYDDVMYAVGHATLPIGTLIMLGNDRGGPTVLCVVTDESLSVSMNVIDVSAAVAKAIGLQANSRLEIFTLK